MCVSGYVGLAVSCVVDVDDDDDDDDGTTDDNDGGGYKNGELALLTNDERREPALGAAASVSGILTRMALRKRTRFGSVCRSVIMSSRCELRICSRFLLSK